MFPTHCSACQPTPVVKLTICFHNNNFLAISVHRYADQGINVRCLLGEYNFRYQQTSQEYRLICCSEVINLQKPQVGMRAKLGTRAEALYSVEILETQM